jgi:hypothetical protein
MIRLFRHILLALLLVVPCGSALAVEVEVARDWSDEAEGAQTPSDRAALRDELMQEAFEVAVGREALTLLPGEIGAEREAALTDVLGARADDYVVGYSELDFAETPTSVRLLLDVRVEREALRRSLYNYGLFHTWRVRLPYALTLNGAAPEELATVSKLQLVSGVYISSTASPELVIGKGEQGWAGRIIAEGDISYEDYAEANTLPRLWERLWATWFGRIPPDRVRTDRFMLSVSGWFAPDEPRAFGRELEGWRDAVREAELAELGLDGPELTARWIVNVVDQESLRRRMEERAESRRLSYRLTPLDRE